MVSDNDNSKGGTPPPVGGDGAAARSARRNVATSGGEGHDQVTSAGGASPHGASRPYNIYTNVTDDFGDRIDVRIEEFVMIGPLVDRVIANLRLANDR